MKKIFCWVLMMLNVGTNVHAFDPDQIQIHGFVSQGYLISDNNDYMLTKTEDGSFQFNEMGINFATQLTDEIRVGLQFLSRDLGEIGNNEVELDWALADYHFRDWLGLQVGKMKAKYGFHNQSRDIDAARTWILLPMGIYNETLRDLTASMTGVGIYGSLPGGLTYQFQAGSLEVDKDSGVARMLEGFGAEVVSMESESDNFTVGLEWETPLDGLRIGVTRTALRLSYEAVFPGMSAPMENDVEGDKTVASLEYMYENFTLDSEYRLLDNNLGGSDNTAESYFAGIRYRFSDWFEAGTYYCVFYCNKDDRDGKGFEAMGLPRELGWCKDIALSVRFDINNNWVFKLEGHHMDGLNGVVRYDPADPDTRWLLFAAKMTFSF
ncbi:hypothetical protein [Desulfonema magnum]|uniref:Porin n=1 Tax=Desulfonema magnum TaxID=45655 RepID=A0A975BTA8_9BACT|nr:hypothetical protein [Desulfonema magnum]QTA91097.1 Uncharacterized protein dnm_071620 [Desulfonema magnum]